MARKAENENGIHRGKVGTLTTYKRLGKYYVRQSIMTSTSNSPKQAVQRSRFKVAMQNLSPLSQVFKVGFAGVAKEGATPFNAGFSYNMSNAMTFENEAYEVDWSRVMVSRGQLPNVTAAKLTTMEDGGSILSWKADNGAEGASEDDQVCVVVVDTANRAVALHTSAKRGDEGLRLDIERDREWAIYVFTMKVDGKVSDSVWVD